MESWEGWHVLRPHRQLHYPPYTPVEVGVPLHATGPLRLHGNGIHATQDILYAMAHTTGLCVCRVQLVGERLDEETQSCARTRVVLWMVEAEPVVLQWAGLCLLRALQREVRVGRSPDPVVWEAARMVLAHPALPAIDPMTRHRDREEMGCPHCRSPLTPVLDVLLASGVKLSTLPAWWFGSAEGSWRRRHLARHLPRLTPHDEAVAAQILCVHMSPVLEQLRRSLADAARWVVKAASLALACLSLIYEPGGLANGEWPAWVTRCCAIAAARATQRHPGVQPCPEEEAWQRATLETLLFARHAAETQGNAAAEAAE